MTTKSEGLILKRMGYVYTSHIFLTLFYKAVSFIADFIKDPGDKTEDVGLYPVFEVRSKGVQQECY